MGQPYTDVYALHASRNTVLHEQDWTHTHTYWYDLDDANTDEHISRCSNNTSNGFSGGGRPHLGGADLSG